MVKEPADSFIAKHGLRAASSVSIMRDDRQTNKGKQMKKSIVNAIACVCALVAFADAKPTVSVTATLKDGSSVRGDFLTKDITGATLFAKNLVLAPSIVKTVNFTSTNGEAKVELSNGDRFTMTVSNGAFAVRSLLGNLKIPRASLRAMSLSARTAAAKGGATGGLIFHCTFDDAASITSPAVGPAGTFMTGTFEDGKIGKALLTKPYTNHAAFEFPQGFLRDSGCIEFWAKILKPSSMVGDGGDPRLLAITRADNRDFVFNVDIVSNDGGGNSGFALRTWYGGKASINGMRPLRYEELFPAGDWRDWHHYAILWDINGISGLSGSPKTALLVDGKLTIGAGHDTILITPSTKAHVLGITCDPALSPRHNTKSPFLIDDIKIWNYAKIDVLP